MSSYDIGNKIRISVEFTDLLNSSVSIDPGTVYCSVRSPSNKTTDYQYGVDSEVTKTDTGDYYFDLPLTEDGHWYVRWWGLDANGVALVAEEVQIECTPHQAD
jgi:hypothetical protein